MWKAIYKDGTYLEQFEVGKENLFSSIDMDRLSIFEVRVYDSVFKVYLDNGEFCINNSRIRFDGYSGQFKLIYYRKVRKVIGTGNTEVATSTTQHLGWQLAGTSNKRVLAILCPNEYIFKEN